MIAEVRINKECGGSGKLEAVLLAGRRPTALLELLEYELWMINIISRAEIITQNKMEQHDAL